MEKKVTVAIAGLGNRGLDTYATCAKKFPDEMEIVAVADIVREKVDKAAKEYNIPPERCFNSAEEMLEQEKLADVMFICTQDRQHVGHAIPALEKGYDLLLEKPVSPELDECRSLAETARKFNRKVVVCHVLRYTPFYQKLKEIIDSGIIGDVVSVQSIENVAFFHQAHSFVRGNWNNSTVTSPMILQKSCHDMDLLIWLMGKKCSRVSSFGSLRLFNEQNAPEGAAKRCLDGCAVKESCPYDAEKIYITNPDTGVAHGHDRWPCSVLTTKHPTEETIREALQTGPYGRCVFHCDNNVVDHQVVNLCMEDGSTASFTMCAFTSKGHRYTKVMGTLGDIDANMDTNIIDVGVFGKPHELIDVSKLAEDFSGHAGGDSRLVHDFLNLVSGNAPATALTSLDRSLESHYIALAAEQSRLNSGESINPQILA